MVDSEVYLSWQTLWLEGPEGSDLWVVVKIMVATIWLEIWEYFQID